MKNRLLDQMKKEDPAGRRLAAILVAGVFFLALFPLAIAVASRYLDRILAIPRWQPGWSAVALAWLVILAGFGFALWSIYVQVTIGRGTPIPLMATQHLVIRPPYSYTRNPMTLGTIVMYLGICVLIGSFSALAIVVVASILLLIYIRLVEEREMLARFGNEYQEYRGRTPFLIPRFARRDSRNGEGQAA